MWGGGPVWGLMVSHSGSLGLSGEAGHGQEVVAPNALSEWLKPQNAPEGQAAPWSGCVGWRVGVLLSGAPVPRPCREAGKTRDLASIHRCWPQGWAGGLGIWGAGASVAMEQGRGPGAGSALAALAPGSHRGGAWLGARVWFEISATGPGLPRDLAERSRDKHWKVGRAS